MKSYLWCNAIIIACIFVFPSCSDNPTKSEDNIPSLSTNEVSAITRTSAQCGGVITSDAGSTITARGVCWSTAITPTIVDFKTIDGAGAGSFISSLTSLTDNTRYYVRAYATNRIGTGYGSAMSFVTMPNTPPKASFYIVPFIGTTRTDFVFDARGCTDAEDSIDSLEVRWDWTNDGIWDTNYSTTLTTAHNYSSSGTYSIKLEVKDSGGLVNTLIIQLVVAVSNEPSMVTINEIFAAGSFSSPDWIELFNRSSSPLDIGGFKIYNSEIISGNKPKRILALGTVIQSLDFLVIEGDINVNSSGDEVWLEDASAVVIENVVIPGLGAAESYGKTVDGGTEWKIWDQATRGFGNNGKDVVIPPVVLNEVFSRGVPGNLDWVEVYNPSNVAISLAGYMIYDSGAKNGAKPKLVFPAGSSAPAKGFFVITVDDTSAANFGLSSGGDEIWLENSIGIVIDYIKIPAMPVETTCYCRIPDGASNWQISNIITRGKINSSGR